MRNSSDEILNETISNGVIAYSETVDLSNIFGYSAQLMVTGAGTSALEASNDKINYTIVEDSTKTFTVDSTLLYVYDGSYYKYFRVAICASGTVGARVVFFSKGV